MLSKSEARAEVDKRLKQMAPPDDIFDIAESETIERPFGWVFFYNSKGYLETGDFFERLAGNGPVLVDKQNGSVHFCGTIKTPQEYIEEYERKV